MRQRRREATANDSSASKVHRREGHLATAQIKPVNFSLLRYKPAELLFSCKAPAPGRAAEGPRRGYVPQAQTA